MVEERLYIVTYDISDDRRWRRVFKLMHGYGRWLLPNKLLEYVTQGVPAVCSRMPTIAEYFDEDAVAYFEPGDPAALARAVDRLLRDPELAARQAARAREVLDGLSWERGSERYVAALRGERVAWSEARR